ncbi:MarR family winged helix-turn-helix transcriptional regulator [Sphaerisporangium corydalis]|uniref:MarR family winged helix-turn-helix transcriptional regulator n=1 Tax=Sphaerisporangium corydalis TaxID=1441875 RepID=A0ABV9EIS2_9ACTN|nr:MarR family winged helix-turn-helix transcriptional regulator [Sphaerisporangium corydalis]
MDADAGCDGGLARGPGQPAAAAGGPISHTIFRLARTHRMLAGRLLREVGLHPGQELLMMHLWETGPLRQCDLAEVFDTDSARMTRTVQRLERAGYVRRVSDPGDGRVTLVESTPAGLSLRDQVEQVWSRLEERTAGQMTAAERAAALASLRHLEDNLLAATTGHQDPPEA